MFDESCWTASLNAVISHPDQTCYQTYCFTVFRVKQAQPPRLSKVFEAPAAALIDASWLQNVDDTIPIMQMEDGPELVATVVETVAAYGWALIGTRGAHSLADQVAVVAADWASRQLGWHMEICALQRAPSRPTADQWLSEAEARIGLTTEELPALESVIDFDESPMGFDMPWQRP